MPAARLPQDLAVARGDGSYGRLLAKIAKTDLLAIDDWMLHPLKDPERRDLLIRDKAMYSRVPRHARHLLGYSQMDRGA